MTLSINLLIIIIIIICYYNLKTGLYEQSAIGLIFYYLLFIFYFFEYR